MRRLRRERMSPEPPDRDRPLGEKSARWSAGPVEIPRTAGWWTQRRPGPPLVDLPGRASVPGARDRAGSTGPAGPGRGSGSGRPTGDDGSDPADEAVPAPALPEGGSGTAAIWLAAIGVVVLILSVHYFPSPRLSRVMVPIIGLCAAIGVGARLQRKHPEEPWLARWLVYAMIVKEFASILRYRTLVNSYGDVGDATVYDKYGQRFVRPLAPRPGRGRAAARRPAQEQLPALVHGHRVLHLRHRHDRRLRRLRA